MNGKPHLDEKIIQLMNEAKEYKLNAAYASKDITTGKVIINSKRVDFEEKALLDHKFTMHLPRNFQSIPPETLYKPESKPDLLLANEGGSVQITIAHIQKKAVNDDEVVAHQNEVRKILESMNPSIEWQPGGSREVEGRQIHHFEFLTPMLGVKIYNLTFFMRLWQRVLTGSFVCTEQELKGWKPIFPQMLDTIRLSQPEQDLAEDRPKRDFSNYHFHEGWYGIYHGKEYWLYRLGEEYRLISTDPRDQENGFYAKDGVFKKSVKKEEITAAYNLKITIRYQGAEFELRHPAPQQIIIAKKYCTSDFVEKYQLKVNEPGVYQRWIDITEIEDVIETKLPVDGFAMPEVLEK